VTQVPCREKLSPQRDARYVVFVALLLPDFATSFVFRAFIWGLELNLQPSGDEPDEVLRCGGFHSAVVVQANSICFSHEYNDPHRFQKLQGAEVRRVWV